MIFEICLFFPRFRARYLGKFCSSVIKDCMRPAFYLVSYWLICCEVDKAGDYCPLLKVAADWLEKIWLNCSIKKFP